MSETASARTFGERSFVWITWWTKSWTTPLPTWRAAAYDGCTPAAEHLGGRTRPVPTDTVVESIGRGRGSPGPLYARDKPPGRGGTPSMESRSAAMPVTPDAAEFVRFCYRRRSVGWPELYDEMCAVAGRALFRGYDADDLAGLGIGFSLAEMPGLAALVAQVIGEDRARARMTAGQATVTAGA